jgi:signal-transduction protein with cAMP-binding, CBS, and nucleotidyltransferase domain
VIDMLNQCDDNEFVWQLAQGSQKLRFDKDDPVYQYNEAAEDFYMIYKGTVKLFAQNGFPYI